MPGNTPKKNKPLLFKSFLFPQHPKYAAILETKRGNHSGELMARIFIDTNLIFCKLMSNLFLLTLTASEAHLFAPSIAGSC